MTGDNLCDKIMLSLCNLYNSFYKTDIQKITKIKREDDEDSDIFKDESGPIWF